MTSKATNISHIFHTFLSATDNAWWMPIQHYLTIAIKAFVCDSSYRWKISQVFVVDLLLSFNFLIAFLFPLGFSFFLFVSSSQSKPHHTLNVYMSPFYFFFYLLFFYFCSQSVTFESAKISVQIAFNFPCDFVLFCTFFCHFFFFCFVLGKDTNRIGKTLM